MTDEPVPGQFGDHVQGPRLGVGLQALEGIAWSDACGHHHSGSALGTGDLSSGSSGGAGGDTVIDYQGYPPVQGYTPPPTPKELGALFQPFLAE